MQETIRQILGIAVNAPSGDNSQPWRFVMDGQTLEIYNLPEKDFPFYNYEQRGSLIAHGALIENIRIASLKFGLSSQVNNLLENFKENLVAKITFEPVAPQTDPLFEAISKRATNRKTYKRGLTDEEKRELIQSISDIPGAGLIFVDDRKNKDDIANASAENERIVLSTEALHTVFFGNVAWDEEQERRQRTGLYLATLELAAPKRFIFKLASKWPIMQKFIKIGILSAIINDNRKLYASGTQIVFTMPTATPKDFFETGMAMQRVWLHLTKLGLSAHPVTGIIFLVQKVLAGQTDGLTEEQVRIVKTGYQNIVQAAGAGDKAVTFMLRAGDGGLPTARSSRKEPDITISR